jgi:hypothetical protein
MRTPEGERAEQGKHAANDSCIEEHADSHLCRELSGERDLEKPAKQRVGNEVADNRDGGYSLNPLSVDGHGAGSGQQCLWPEMPGRKLKSLAISWLILRKLPLFEIWSRERGA